MTEQNHHKQPNCHKKTKRFTTKSKNEMPQKAKTKHRKSQNGRWFSTIYFLGSNSIFSAFSILQMVSIDRFSWPLRIFKIYC